ncbi:YdcH family protein, partial [Stutzerimonas nitrititolerans]
MHVEHHSLSKDFPEKQAQLLKLSQEDPTFARKAENYEALSQRIRSLEDGADSATLESLKQEHSVLK